MYIFRRAAARAVSAPRQLRATPRIASFQSSIPSLSRSFYQSRILRAEEQKEPTSSSQQDAVSESSGTTSEPLGQSEHQSQEVAESTPEPTQTPASSTSSPQDAVSESSGTTSEPVGQSEQESKPVAEQASELAEKAKETVSDVAAKTAQAVGEFTQQPQEKAQDAASEVSEQAQSAASSVAQATRNTARSARNAVNERYPSSPAPASKILYVGNLFFEVTAPQLEAEFGKYGEIANSRVVTDDRGLSKGFAYIEMSNQKEADAAIAALNQHPFQGRRMSVQYHRRRTPRNGDNPNAGHDNKPSKTLFIGNMSYQMSDRDLNDLFRQIKNVLDVRVAIDRRSGQPRGFAHADFIDVESATKAKEILEQKAVYGRQLRVNYSGQSPSDARPRDDRPRGDRSRDDRPRRDNYRENRPREDRSREDRF